MVERSAGWPAPSSWCWRGRARSTTTTGWRTAPTSSIGRLVVVLAAAAIARPAFLVPFVIVVRVVNEQFLFPFGTTAARNVDDLLLMALLIIAAGHVLFVVTGRNRTAPVVLLITTAWRPTSSSPARASCRSAGCRRVTCPTSRSAATPRAGSATLAADGPNSWPASTSSSGCRSWPEPCSWRSGRSWLSSTPVSPGCGYPASSASI